MTDEPMSDEQLEALRQALDEAMLMHTGRSIGDLASGQVARDVVGTLHVWLQQQLEQQLAIPVYGPEPMADEPMANYEPMSDRWLETFRREIALAFGTHHSGPVAEAVTRNAEKDLFYLIEEYQRLRAREAAAMAIVRAVATQDVIAYEGDAGDEYCCVFCGAGYFEFDWQSYEAQNLTVAEKIGTKHLFIRHSPDCFVTKARTLLAQDEE